MNDLRRLLGRLQPYRWTVALVFGCIVIAQFGAMVPQWLTKVLIDQVVYGKRYDELFWLCAILLVARVLRGLADYFHLTMREYVSVRTVFDFRRDLYNSLQYQSHRYLGSIHTGQLMSRLTSDIENVRIFLAMGFYQAFIQILSVASILGVLFVLSWKLTIVCMLTAPFLVLEVRKVHKKLIPAWGAVHKQMATLTAVLQQSITGVRVVQAFTREPYEFEKFNQENNNNREKQLNLSGVWGKSFPYIDFLTSLSWVLLLGYGAWLVMNHEITVGTLMAFNAYLWMYIFPIRDSGRTTNVFVQATTAARRLFEILDSKSEVVEPAEPVVLQEVKGHIQFDAVSLRYNDHQEVLSNININATPGKRIALIGMTGSGKTSLLSLIPRFFDPSAGQVLLDGIDIRNFALADLRHHVGMVLQETVLFSATIRDNIAFGKPDAAMEEVIAAAKAARADDFIMNFPDGYDTLCGERGVGLSGGQKQRIAIARTLLSNPRILLLDDATSSVDMETEHLIQEALEELMKGRTTLLVGQRLTTVKGADEIVVLSEGKIIERGTHEQLLKNRGYYYRLYELQFADQVDEWVQREGVESFLPTGS
ncbi:MAG: multidrug transporter ATP-binding protein [Bacilli bacterium]|nr:multidrug transporter ATP-binding protein [Bacilli bacterium]